MSNQPPIAKSISWVMATALLVGCNNNPYAPNQPASFGGAPPLQASYEAQMAEIQRRVQALDDNNRQLTTQLAQSQQQVQVFRDRADLVQRQLQDVTAQLSQARVAQQEAQSQVRGLQASTQLRGGATLTANNSLLRQAEQLRIPGAAIQADGDVVRIRIPADQLFAPGTDKLTGSATAILDPISEAILRTFPRQRISVEGHTDNGALYGGAYASPMQLSTAQAMAVVDLLVRRNRVPANQLFTVGHGPNHPRADNQTAAGRAENRRIEIVVYPDTF